MLKASRGEVDVKRKDLEGDLSDEGISCTSEMVEIDNGTPGNRAFKMQIGTFLIFHS
jgi:hypothetical protein